MDGTNEMSGGIYMSDEHHNDGGEAHRVNRLAERHVTVGLADGERTTNLYRVHMPGAIRLAYLLTGDQSSAEDVAHDAFLSVASRRAALRSEDAFALYLRRTVVRAVLARHRSRERELKRMVRAHNLDERRDVPNHDAGAAHRLDLFEAMNTLPPRQRAAVVLRYWQDLSEGEIALALHCRPGTVKSTLSRALEALRKVIGDE